MTDPITIVTAALLGLLIVGSAIACIRNDRAIDRSNR